MKAVGVLLVVLSCSGMGVNMARSLRRRAGFIHGLVYSLTLLRNELCASLLPVKEVLAMLARNKGSESREFFECCLELFENSGFRNAWSTAAMDGRRWGLEEEECRMLASLSDVIGRYEAEKQRELIDRVADYFNERARLAEETTLRQCKLRTALGIGSGLMLAILML